MFQFQCPNGHLLEGDESQAGQQVHCPTCGLLFIIPAPLGAPAGPFPPQSGGIAPGPSAMGPTAPLPAATHQSVLYHIPCPNGHELETPSDMLNQDVLCPVCSVQFRLREKDSVEYKKKRRDELEKKERRLSRIWFNWAIVIAVLVLVFLLGLIFMSGST